MFFLLIYMIVLSLQVREFLMYFFLQDHDASLNVAIAEFLEWPDEIRLAGRLFNV